ncbi:MAG: putative Mg2+ transporter-C (MgtC) family protein [Flavobacteriaceae bacterium]|jgi:putative Mg2+ transporter-C (MgtC) family protein
MILEDIFLRLIIAVVLGAILGIDRTIANKEAGMRTYALISFGAALFVIISEAMFNHYSSLGFANSFEISRIPANIVSGIGFLGAGIILFKEKSLTGLTTASGMWVTAGIGMAVGFGLLKISILATLLVLLIFTLLWHGEDKIRKYFEIKKEK